MTSHFPNRSLRSGGGRSGFTLVELLTVMTIMSILLYITLPVTASLQEGNKLSVAGQTVIDELAVAREYAASRNQTVYVRFITPTSSAYHGYDVMQLWQSDPANPGQFVAVDHMVQLPTGIEISSDSTISPLVSTSGLAGTTSSMSIGATTGNYVAFTVRPDGNVIVPVPPSGNAAALNLKYFLTLLPVRYDTVSSLPKNYVTVQVNPDTASTQFFRP